MKILGINDQHNASACLLDNGVVVAALQEERLSGVKNEYCFPHGAVRWVLEEAGVTPGALDWVALASLHIPPPFTRDDLMDWFANLHSPATQARRLLKRTPAMTVARRRRRDERLAEVERAGLPVARTRFVEHHTAHAAAAYHGSPWKDEPVLVLTADGEGDGLSATVRLGREGLLGPPLAVAPASDSLGLLYSMVTFLMGMVPYEHEYKLMGLAPYAPEAGARESIAALEGLLGFEGADALIWRRDPKMPDARFCYRFVRDRLERHRFDWIAAGLQHVTEELLVEWVGRCIARTGVRRVALSGGVFMNVKANQRILELPEVDGLFVFPSCGDETNSMGAAFHTVAQTARLDEPATRVPALGDLYWGPAPTESEIEPLLGPLRAQGYEVARPEDPEDATAELLAQGAIVARARGRMEFGARSLGNRSILADPTRRDAVRIINDMVKNRDFWMPFAPAMLAEHSDRYVVNPKGMDAPYMIITFDTTERSEDFPAGLQPADRTARPQFVHREHNPELHRLISCFAERTGRSVVLNTSFNLHGFPIVCTAEDAIRVLERSGLKHLLLGDYLISKAGVARDS